jgi:biotin carboxyl carrier protein
MKRGQTTGNPTTGAYVAVTGGEEYAIGISRTGEVTVNDSPRNVHLESIDGHSLFSVLVGAKSYEVFVERRKDGYCLTVEGQRYEVQVSDQGFSRPGAQGPVGAREPEARPLSAPAGREDTGARKKSPGVVTSPMTGVLVEVLVEEEQNVKAGDGVAILEAMKTENVIRAPCDGRVKSVEAATGATLRMDDVILFIDASLEG